MAHCDTHIKTSKKYFPFQIETGIRSISCEPSLLISQPKCVRLWFIVHCVHWQSLFLLFVYVRPKNFIPHRRTFENPDQPHPLITLMRTIRFPWMLIFKVTLTHAPSKTTKVRPIRWASRRSDCSDVSVALPAENGTNTCYFLRPIIIICMRVVIVDVDAIKSIELQTATMDFPTQLICDAIGKW